ncbi:probable LRR receptor-like serine/threonine-protein kinase At3g47570 [Vicia villosa]|uniref:probable LRR receptor-like serine/threonine-protein kinase At3g47570 n=1 Tax=Vicia villosa TaxID=3911 RepID=UPI00273CCD07|nr:probable LRR receptor-like serine/threonine-protein kinase At3g47570 [Vicia villosa]
MIHVHHILFLCFLLHNFHFIICITNNTDRDILLSFKLQLTDPNNVLSNWTTDSNHCTWYGVNCSKAGERVQSLTLSGLGLSGKLPSNLSNLTSLLSLNLSNNTFHGQIPFQFSHLTLLTVIQLARNNLSGTLPPQLGQLHNLQSLDFSVNNLTGEIPSTFGNLISLESLSMARNKFVGEIPIELANLRNLSTLQLSENNFSGKFPTSIFLNLSSLVFLSLTLNNLSGELPQNIGNALPNLTTLAIATNRFDGVIQNSISNSSHLQTIDLSNNRFHGPIPLFNNLKNLTILTLANNFLTSTTSLNLQFFDSLRNSTQLQILKVNYNNLTGELPNSVAYLSSNLQQFCVSNNQLNGSIPKGMNKFQNLTSFSFEWNNFTGEFPMELGTLKKLQQLWIHQNRLFGEIPDIFGNFTNLYQIAMRNNQFTGRIPASIGQCKSLNYLDLGMNRLVGVIPMEIFQLSGLRTLYLRGNSLNGSLPPVLNMEQLEVMIVSDNKLSGNISNIEANGLKVLQMARNKFSGSIPNSLGDSAFLETLDLSSNNLSGSIPENLEELKYLVSLNLSFNKLEGEVPMKGVFMNLSQVDLQGNNRLCGLNYQVMQKLGVTLCVAGKKNKRNNLLLIILPIIGAAVLFVSVLSLLWMLYSSKTEKKEEKRSLSKLSSTPLKGLPQNISYDDIRLATNNFSATNLVGKGGFGSVYKGVFNLSTYESQTTTLAVKVFDLQQSKACQSFSAECETLKNVRHRNLVKVITSCSSTDHKGDDFKALVMHFIPNGNLEMSLYPEDLESGSSLTLLQRLNIAIDVASALDYLHRDCDPPIVHCDLKPLNVLLDENMVAHVADFGLARFLPQNASEKRSSTLELNGSIGYIAPEYGLGGKASTSGDVYSFGILLLEMLIAKKPTDEMFKEGLNMDNFVSEMDAKQLLNVVDQRLINHFEYSIQSFSSDSHSGRSGDISYSDGSKTYWTHNAEECIAAAMRIGLSCVAHHPKDRLTMREALSKLHGIKQSVLDL